MGEHLRCYPARDSWVECGLRNGFIAPYFRLESTNLSKLLDHMEKADRRGFSIEAKGIAERIDRTPYSARHWSSPANSESFGKALRNYMNTEFPPMLESRIDPDDFAGFWFRSRDWMKEELDLAHDRSSHLLGSDGILLSQLIQASGERLMGTDCGRIGSVNDLLVRIRREVGRSAERDLRAYYTCACEIYNRSLADTLLTAPNSPDWQHFIAAMDLWNNQVSAGNEEIDDTVVKPDFEITERIRLPRPVHLRNVSGDVLLTIRSSQSCQRYFESLAHWRADPHDTIRQGELVEALHRYSEEIRNQVGKDVGFFGLKPQFISKTSDVSRALERSPSVIQGFLAVGATTGAAAGTATGSLVPAAASAGLFSLFCLQLAAKYYLPSRRTRVGLSARHGVRISPDVTVTRA